MLTSLKSHWPEYLMEAAHLGSFMIAACLVALILDHPSSPLHRIIPDPTVRRFLTGIAMGLTAIGIVYSPWGRQSGAHFNPALTLTFLRLKKVSAYDAVFYVAAQFSGGVAGVLLVAAAVGSPIGHPSVNYVATLPGPYGMGRAFAAELLISFLQMILVLTASNHQKLARFTGLLAGTLVAVFISLEAPLSGMSMNPARTFGSAFAGRLWTGLWIYFTAPLAGMLLAAEVYLLRKGASAVHCAKLHHQNDKRCIFCEHQDARKRKPVPQALLQPPGPVSYRQPPTESLRS